MEIGMREPTSFEASMLLGAVDERNPGQVSNLVTYLYPNILWGSVYKTLTDEEKEFVTKAINDWKNLENASVFGGYEEDGDYGSG